jgi:hypothetical protein
MVLTDPRDLLRQQVLRHNSELTPSFKSRFAELSAHQTRLGMLVDYPREQELDWNRSIQAGMTSE